MAHPAGAGAETTLFRAGKFAPQLQTDLRIVRPLPATYDTFLNYLNQLKYEIGSLRLPPYIEAAIGLLEPLRIASERLRIRKTNGTWTLLEVVEETMRILQERSHTALNQRITPSDRLNGPAPAASTSLPNGTARE